MEAYLRRVGQNQFVIDQADDGWLSRGRIGETIRAQFTRPRNYKFLKKYMALINTAFDWWEPREMEWQGRPVTKNIDRFRHDLQILAGYGHPVVNLRGEVRIESDSISFAAMDEGAFTEVYDAVLQVILDKVLTRGDADRLNDAVDAIMSFA